MIIIVYRLSIHFFTVIVCSKLYNRDYDQDHELAELFTLYCVHTRSG